MVSLTVNTVIVAVILVFGTRHTNPVPTIIAFGTFFQVIDVFARYAFAAYCRVSISVTFVTEQIVNLRGIINFANPTILANKTVTIRAFYMCYGFTTAPG